LPDSPPDTFSPDAEKVLAKIREPPPTSQLKDTRVVPFYPGGGARPAPFNRTEFDELDQQLDRLRAATKKSEKRSQTHEEDLENLCQRAYQKASRASQRTRELNMALSTTQQDLANLDSEFHASSTSVSKRLTNLEEQSARMKDEFDGQISATKSSMDEQFTDEIQAMESRLDRRSIERFEGMKQLFKETREEMDERFTKKSQEMNGQVTERLEEMGRRFTDGIKEVTALVQGQQEHMEKLASEDATARKEGHEILRHVSAVLLQMERLPLAGFGGSLADVARSLTELRRMVEGLLQHSTE
jgi:DNA repair exonuclease SbcCD ATPase subunit